MAKKNETPSTTLTGETPVKKTRKTSASHPLVIAAQTQVKEAKALAKVIDEIPKLGEWSIAQILTACEKREIELACTAPPIA